jgi:formylglycine-generating enzyme required for sulfatase activity
MKLTYIPAGEFTMGSPSGESDRDEDETLHRVRLSRPFLMGVTEVTQGQWEALMGSRPWEGKSAKSNPSHAASYVSWDDAVEFCRKLSEQAGKTYRLPTEAEWEYACRGGTTSMYHFGDNVSELGRFGWFAENAKGVGERYAHVVGQKLPNGWGLYDMHGNVYEWCGDWYGDYPSGTVTDPRGPGSGSNRVLRGGSWFSYSLFSRSACRYGTSPGLRTHNLGFRLVLDF